MIPVELVAEAQEWNKNRQRVTGNKNVKVRINYGVRDLGIKLKSYGVVWNKKEGVWECKYEIAKTLVLKDRIVDNESKTF